MKARAVPVVSAEQCARIVIARAELSESKPVSSAKSVAAMVRRLGYVQIDSIAAVERAHDTILRTRLRGYSAQHLRQAAERDRTLFEHWTHDASFVPVEWLPYWHTRFRRDWKRLRAHRWWVERAGTDGPRLMSRVMAHVTRQGATRARDLNPPNSLRENPAGGWWEWTPGKAALETLWRSGRLAVARRDGFQKEFDLFERVHPQISSPRPSAVEHRHWACSQALARLGVATAKEIAAFFGDLDARDVDEWAKTPRGKECAVRVQRTRADGARAERAYAAPDALNAIPDPPETVRILSPFDPIVRDRARLEKVWGFFYRFEAFVPAPKRVDGYYTMPVLCGERFIGRCALRVDRTAGTMTLERWRAEGRASALPPRVKAAIHAYADELNLTRVQLTPR